MFQTSSEGGCYSQRIADRLRGAASRCWGAACAASPITIVRPLLQLGMLSWAVAFATNTSFVRSSNDGVSSAKPSLWVRTSDQFSMGCRPHSLFGSGPSAASLANQKSP